METIAKEDHTRIDKLKIALGIDTANCSSCFQLGTEGDGYEYNGTWPICNKIDRMGYLKSFPFKKEMKCWQPDFWHSKFSAMIKNGTDEEMENASSAYREAYEGV